MAILKLVNQGWVRKQNGGIWQSVPNTCYILSGKKKIIVDPGNDPNLEEILETKSIWPEEVHSVFLTHTHIDHIRHIGLFPDAEIIDPVSISRSLMSYPHGGFIPDTDIRIIKTPGHSEEHASLLVPTDLGNIVVCGDLFWWEGEGPTETTKEELLSLPDDLAYDFDLLKESRKKVLEIEAIRYIPGHGKPFKLKDQ